MPELKCKRDHVLKSVVQINSKCEAERGTEREGRGTEREKRGEGDGKEERKRHHSRKVLNTPVDPVAE